MFHRSSDGSMVPKGEASISVDFSGDVQETAGKVCCRRRRSPSPPPPQRKARHERGRSLQFSVASALSVLRTQSLGVLAGGGNSGASPLPLSDSILILKAIFV